MSRSYNEISTPNERGRVGVKKTKRRSSKQVRRLLELDSRVEKLIRKRNHLDRDQLNIKY